MSNASSTFLGMSPTGEKARQAVAASNEIARQKLQIPACFFPYDARIPLGDASGKRENPSPFFGEKKEDKKPLAVEHVFIAGVI